MEKLADGYLEQDPSFATRAIHVGQDADQWSSHAVAPPITLTSTFKQHGAQHESEFVYGRLGNPTRKVLEQCLATLDGAKYALTFSSGMGAISAVIQLLQPGDHLVSGDDVYGGTNKLFSEIASTRNVETTFVDTTDPENIRRVLRPNTKIVWIESTTNPLMKVTDIRAVAKITQSRGVRLVVDNTFLSSYFLRPLQLGADIALYSLTKYSNGHSDVIMGSISTNSDQLYQQLKFVQYGFGIIPSPFDCYLVNRSLKTLAVRMREHMKNAMKVAQFLESHPYVEKVLHPGLPSHPQHELSKRQSYGHSGMLSFYIKGGVNETKAFLKALNLFTHALSLGGFESLAEVPSLMSHSNVPREHLQELGITDSLIRLSVGLESADDLIDDLSNALSVAANNKVRETIITYENLHIKENNLLAQQNIGSQRCYYLER